jgi:hypothetical protein
MAVAASVGRRTMHSTTLSFLIGLASATALMAQHGRYLNESRNSTINDPKAVEAGAKCGAATAQLAMVWMEPQGAGRTC